MKLLKNTLIASAIALSMSNAASAATLNVTNGILMGASGVNVSGEVYDVIFKDDMLSKSVSAFTTNTSARTASQALLDQVFNNNNVFDVSPFKTNGCADTYNCYIGTGYLSEGNNGYLALAANANGTQTDYVTSGSGNANTAGLAGWTLAIWTKTSATAVPEPEAYAMMLAGLGLVGFAARRKKQAVKSKALSQY